MKRYILILCVLILAGLPLKAQFNMSGEFRPRTEYSHGYKNLAGTDQKASLFTSQRTRLNLGFDSNRITTKLVLQDVRNWGSQRQLVTNEDFGISIHEAWAAAKLHHGIVLQMGRQELVYDNHRIFGNVGWAQQGRTHDLFLAKYEGPIKVHIGLAYNQSGVRTNDFYYGPDAYKAMQFLWLNKTFKKHTISILVLNNGKEYTVSKNDAGRITEQGIRYSQTIGTQISRSGKRLSATGNFYYQMGTDASGQTINAYEYMIDASLKLSKKTGLGLSYEVLSGTETGSSENNSFTPLYGTNHKFNGHMDYFFVGNHANSVGLQDITFKASQKIHRATINVHVHGFLSAVELPEGNYFGTEADIFVVHPISDNLKIQVGYSQFFASEAFSQIRTGDITETHNWAYLMFSFTPKFIK